MPALRPFRRGLGRYLTPAPSLATLKINAAKLDPKDGAPASSMTMKGPLVPPSEKLAELGLELPAVATPAIAYVPTVIDRGIVCTSDQIPVVNGGPVCIGAVGEDDADPEDTKDAARTHALNALAAAAPVADGIDNLTGVVKIVGFVSSHPDFYGQASVINGASELFGEIFDSQHARSAVGVTVLPLNVSVEVEAEFLIKWTHGRG